MSTNVSEVRQAVLDDVNHWFFEDYLPTWVGVAAGTVTRGPDFVLDYWSAPLQYSDDLVSAWFLDAEAVTKFLADLHERLKENGYTHTVVPDHRSRVYSENGAAIEVIWSRCGEAHEIERLAVHFEVARGEGGWRVVGIQTTPTTASSLDAVWP
ncbi:hypothetical protein [Mycobacterium sp. OTB74]|uniref:DUF6841 family protein n=1 Tax=Mycobacterium sp. OTB74 TaxID=1853452 RepID=UPI002475C36F|nr:hypothetical protein [Mycobacterium sp. OTB74]MDH6244071.1 hypothetical protein [Mycobacterium sp. OTB74]